MPSYTVKELAELKKVSERTFYSYMKQLKRTGKFTKNGIGQHYGETDAKNIARLMDFTIPGLTDKPTD